MCKRTINVNDRCSPGAPSLQGDRLIAHALNRRRARTLRARLASASDGLRAAVEAMAAEAAAAHAEAEAARALIRTAAK